MNTFFIFKLVRWDRLVFKCQ